MDKIRKGDKMLEIDENNVINDNEKKKRKIIIRLKKLVANNMIRDGQTVYLVDSIGQRVGNESAIIRQNKLRYDGKEWDMSSLAKELLGKHNIINTLTIQGPKHWQIESGETIHNLNEKLKQIMKKS